MPDDANDQQPLTRFARGQTYLAGERTFLAYLRTGITLVALGLAAAQFVERDTNLALPLVLILALFLVGGGLFSIIVGWRRYADLITQIDHEVVTPSHRPILTLTILGVVAGVVTAVLVVAIEVTT